MTQDAGFPHHPDVKPHRTERTGKTHQEISELKNRQMGRIEKLGCFPLIKQFWGQLQTQGNNKMLHLILQMFARLRSFIGQSFEKTLPVILQHFPTRKPLLRVPKHSFYLVGPRDPTIDPPPPHRDLMLTRRNGQTLNTSFEHSTSRPSSPDLYICPLHVMRLTTGSGALNVAGGLAALVGKQTGTHTLHSPRWCFGFRTGGRETK